MRSQEVAETARAESEGGKQSGRIARGRQIRPTGPVGHNLGTSLSRARIRWKQHFDFGDPLLDEAPIRRPVHPIDIRFVYYDALGGQTLEITLD